MLEYAIKSDNLAGNRVAPERCFPEHFFSAITKYSGVTIGGNEMIKIGEKYGRLTVMEEAGRTNSGRLQFKCLCDCGNETIVESSNVERGYTTSCGCYLIERRKKHEMINTSEYFSWQGMKDRCTNKNATKYSDYGERGITVCDRWLESFENFSEDMGKKPSSRHSIDRKDNDGNYEPGNCHWATDSQQSLNKRNNHNLTFKGETHPVIEWERILGFKEGTVKQRILHGWSTIKALTTPVRKTNRWHSNEFQEEAR